MGKRQSHKGRQMSLRDYIAFNSYLCPMCHFSTLYSHPEAQYSREWNKCSSCSFSETKIQTHSRVSTLLLDSSQTWDQVFLEKAKISPFWSRIRPSNNTLDQECAQKISPSPQKSPGISNS